MPADIESHFIQNLASALKSIEEARLQAKRHEWSGMYDDLRRWARDLDEMMDWCKENGGWSDEYI